MHSNHKAEGLLSKPHVFGELSGDRPLSVRDPTYKTDSQSLFTASPGGLKDQDVHDHIEVSSTPSEKDVCEEWAQTSSRTDLRNVLGKSDLCVQLLDRIKIQPGSK